MSAAKSLMAGHIEVDDTFAEAFDMKVTRVIVTAHNLKWARHAGETACGFATSVIACGCEAAIESTLRASQTPDGRPGVALLFFAVSGTELGRQLERRIGQCVLTCPSTAAFAGFNDGKPVGLGKALRFFGDGWQMSKKLDGQRYWRIPVMDGEFVVQENTFIRPAVGGGNLLILADDLPAALTASETAVAAMRKVPGVIMPFPGGVVRSGSKVGSKYPALSASTNDAYCPTLRAATDSALDARTGAVLEIVIDGITADAIATAMADGLAAIAAMGPDNGVHRISAGNYGGKLGAHHFHLKDLL